MNKRDIDIIITWVDGNDPEWIKEKNRYSGNPEATPSNRYRDWDNLQYVFRGIEEYMPWVRHIFFVTWGHLPKWLDTSNPKLTVVRHEDYIPAEYLPTFNSNTIITNLFRIRGLSEQFIYFNDDTFVINPTKAEDFFVNGVPRDMACISPQPILRDSIRNIEINNLKIINDHFSMEDIKKNKKKWLDFRNYGSYALRTMLFMKFSTIIGIYEPHIPYPQLKSTVEKIWDLEYKELDATGRNRFRNIADVSEWLFRSWQLVSGNFIPRSRKYGMLCSASDLEGVETMLHSGKSRLLCINDDDSVTDFDTIKTQVNKMLEEKFPKKSSFEL